MIAVSQFSFRAPPVAENKAFIAPPPHLEFFSFGFQMPLADNLWIRAIQDIDFCENEISKQKCTGNSWLFQMLDRATTLAPDHLPIYKEGGVALSVLLSDIEGAARIYQKGTAIFKDDFALYYRAGTHAYIEEKNKAKAAQFFLRAAQIQGLEGSWLYSLASRLYTDSGQKDIALRLYHDMKKQGLQEYVLKRMREKLGITDE
ncbi:MAG: tetratricopeptide repeat protein [Pseudobdellovibrionaceae bacterium]